MGTYVHVHACLARTQVWLSANYIGFNTSGVMYEKYSALMPGRTGSGGEYIPQTGFGWTNGVALDLMRHYCVGNDTAACMM